MTTSTPPEPTYPRSVIPGIETQKYIELEDGRMLNLVSPLPPAGFYAGLDWIRLTGSEDLREVVESVIHDRFPTEQCSSSNGAKWFKHGLVWHPGILLSWGHRSDICQIDIRGDRCQGLNGHERIELLRSLMGCGLEARRIDGALDWIGQDINVCVAARQSCERGELCLLRTYRLGDECSTNGYPTGRYLALGSRTSPTFVRVYDKGLERGVSPPGYWERIEAEWKDDRAPQVATMLLNAGSNWADNLVALVLGCVDFREVNGRSELERRTRSQWWTGVLEDRDTVRVAPAVVEKNFERWHRAFVSAYGPRLLEMGEAVGEPVAAIVTMLLAGVKPSDRGGPVLAEFVQTFSEIRERNHA